ncbi:4084_t:CDS:2 [Funneliformis geosporum]|uniref:4084_t:CDS:1 n=1 Tax=Funneliformis geosporum TaxID=1117311 RepID=A0A9W4SMY6_9GLOM|nr:4084_t:CDS:2 [Funneliformis geosporum]
MPKVLWSVPIPDLSIHLNPKCMRLSEIQIELVQLNILFEEKQRVELSELLQITWMQRKIQVIFKKIKNGIPCHYNQNNSLPQALNSSNQPSEENKSLEKGGVACIAKEVVELLKVFFHVGNANSSQHYLLEDIASYVE